MKAGILYKQNDIRWEEMEEPKIKENYIKVNVKMCGICGSDVPRVNKGTAHYFPIVLGHEFSGVVTEIGAKVEDIKINDHVAVIPLVPCYECIDCKNGNYSLCKNYSFIGSRVQGGFAEYVVVPKENVIKIDKKLDFKEGAMFEPATVAIHGIKCANYKVKDNVLVIGCGTIGAFTLQWLKYLGTKNIVVFVIDEPGKKLALKLGADFVFNTLTDDYKDKINEITNNRGFDYVFDAVGANSTINQCFEYITNKGTVTIIGTPTSDITFTPKMWEKLNRKEFILTGSWMAYSAPFPGDEWTMTKKAFEEGKLKLENEMINKVYDCHDIDKAFDEYNNKLVSGRTIIEIK